ncbi:MAG: CpsD/CapB family tyrosine-protein kinase [Clostridia bacterium]|nr:CpsD/CapB family tyrosine-protein kinase [Clostridia bacterium]
MSNNETKQSLKSAAKNAKEQKIVNARIENIKLDRKNMLTKKSSFTVKEAYNSARTNLLFLKKDKGCQRLAFTSCYPSEGKTINCVNMAISLSQNNKKVLLVDCDMRRPRIRHMFDVPASPGLSEHLAGIEETPMIREAKDYPNLSLLTAGKRPPNPAELLSSDAMIEMLDKLSSEYDYILLDTPPVNVVTDAAVLKRAVHGYLMVVRAGMTQHDEVTAALAKLEQLEANVLGFILNDAFTQGGSRYGRYGRYSRYARYRKYSNYSETGDGKYGYRYGGYRYGYGYGTGYGYGGGYGEYK